MSSSVRLFTQSEIGECGTTHEAENDSNPNDPPGVCFDETEVFEDCTPLYVRVNVHWFLEDDCSGSVDPAGWLRTTLTPFVWSEQLVDRANDLLGNNADQWNAVPAWDAVFVPASCNPIRVVLSGVYVHCASDGKNIEVGGSNLQDFETNYGVNTSSEINIFYTNVVGGASGFAKFIGGPGTASFAMEINNTKTFVHEIGHLFGLVHSHIGDGCIDTPEINFEWDLNCDGDTFDPKERGRQCNPYIVNNSPPSHRDHNGNGIDDCEEDQQSPPCDNNPCCNPFYHNNNLMAYVSGEGIQHAITDCQIGKMLNDLNRFKCHYLEQIGGDCPPSQSHIVELPNDRELYKGNACLMTLRMWASYNEVEYKADFYEIINGIDQLHHTTDWVLGEAGDFQITVNDGWGAGVYFKPNTEYKAVLITKSACDTEDVYEYIFTTPQKRCFAETELPDLSVTPNPGLTGLATVEFTIHQTAEVNIIGFDINNGLQTVIQENQVFETGTHTLNFDISNWQQGVHTVVILADDQIQSTNFVKL